MYFVHSNDVEWADAAANYVRLHAGGRAHLIRRTMTALESQLDPERFVRVHRSAIINVDCVSQIEPYVRGEYIITLRDGTRLTSSRAHHARLRALLERSG
jgi:two-component system LytT family response regulator